MSGSVATQLRKSRELLDELTSGVHTLQASFPEAFSDSEVVRRVEAFHTAATETARRLASPALSLATIGTTSSGKSTIVNGLIGRRVAPVEAGEMSGGVLYLKDAPHRTLTVAATEGAEWETGTWTDQSDRDMYGRTRDQVMRRYHEVRRTRDCIAPEVTITGPLLPVHDRSLLDLPATVDVEFVDLPGLKSIRDRANLAVLQKRVHRSFGLVALDYLETDDEKRRHLLEELKDVVRNLGGKPQSMLFLLNRVDARATIDDLALSERLKLLQHEIRDVLQLEELPEVLPMCARLLYYAECSWGPVPLGGDPSTTPEERVEFLQALFTDCAAWLKIKTGTNREVRSWLRDVEDQLGPSGGVGEPPSVEDHRRLVHLAREWSGGALLWSRLRDRLASSVAEMVLYPALAEVFERWKELFQAWATVSTTHQIESKEEVEQRLADLDLVQDALLREVQQTRDMFRGRIETSLGKLIEGNEAARAQFVEGLDDGFIPFLDAVAEVRKDLSSRVIVLVRDALKRGTGTYELEEKLQEVLSPVHAHELARAYDLLSRRIATLPVVNEHHEFRICADAANAEKQVEDVERDSRRLFLAMRRALTARAEFLLQGILNAIRAALAGLLRSQASALRELCATKLARQDFDPAVLAGLADGLNTSHIELPDTLFSMPEGVARKDEARREKTGVTAKQVTTGPCCWESTETVFVDKFENIQYRVVTILAPDLMAKQWASGVAAGETELWGRLVPWMTEALGNGADAFSEAVDEVLELARRSLRDQRTALQREHEGFVARWRQFDAGVGETERVSVALRRLVTPQTGTAR